jgi:thiosulfate/3-mercaptopyruvate sulfurtransferase
MIFSMVVSLRLGADSVTRYFQRAIQEEQAVLADKQEVKRQALLISADELAAALREVSASPATDLLPLVVVDCRFNLLKPGAGRAAYLSAHIPGAWYADLDRDLSGPRGSHTGRHPLPDPENLRALFGRFGINPGTRVVAYDEGGGGLAARLWWLLRWMGHRPVVLLDGGLAAWERAGLPLSQATPAPRHDVFHGQPGQMPVLQTDEIRAALNRDGIRLLDVRTEERFQGRAEPIDPVAGHIPGALNVPFSGNLAADGRFQTTEYLAHRYGSMTQGRESGQIVCMCGSGVTACQGIFALELAGVPGVALYPGSWSEWIRSSDRPVAVG